MNIIYITLSQESWDFKKNTNDHNFDEIIKAENPVCMVENCKV